MSNYQLEALLDMLRKRILPHSNEYEAMALLVTNTALVDIALSLRTLVANQERATLERIRASMAVWDEVYPVGPDLTGDPAAGDTT